MSKVKLDDRIQNAINAFFETQPEPGSLAVNYSAHDELMASDEPAFSEKFGKWSTILRELLLFGPGTLSLYWVTLVLIFFYPTLGLPLPGLLMLAMTAFITYAGAGDIRKVKNLAVPATVIICAAAVSAVRSIFPVPEILSPYFSWAIYMFPVALIAAKLVQMWLKDKY